MRDNSSFSFGPTNTGRLVVGITVCFAKLLTFLILMSQAFAQSSNTPQPDFDREARWRAEVVPTVVVGDPIDLEVNGRKVLALLTPGKPNRPTIVLIHGVGVHPDHGVIGVLRTKLADQGYTTLSVQMPVLSKETTDPNAYAAIFPHASARIAAAGDYAKKLSTGPVILLSHSMGSWMSNVYLADTAQIPYRAWICLSITGRIGSTGEHRLPILDVMGENDLVPVRRGALMRRLTIAQHPGSERLEIAGADHFYAGKDVELITQIDRFIQSLPR